MRCAGPGPSGGSDAIVVACCADGSPILADPVARTVLGVLEFGREAFGEIALAKDDNTAFVLSSYELQVWDITTGVQLSTFDDDLPMRRIALAGPYTLVVGSEVVTPVTIWLERA